VKSENIRGFKIWIIIKKNFYLKTQELKITYTLIVDYIIKMYTYIINVYTPPQTPEQGAVIILRVYAAGEG